jgi:iron-sulfur cluster insertion protein
MITIDPSAVDQIKDILSYEADKDITVRMFVQGGGCSGFQYGFTLDKELADDDFTIEQSGVKIIIDAMSMQYISGSTLKYQDDLNGSQFLVVNPKAETTCGCGSSFSI